jgi:hypothetical protein
MEGDVDESQDDDPDPSDGGYRGHGGVWTDRFRAGRGPGYRQVSSRLIRPGVQVPCPVPWRPAHWVAPHEAARWES